MMDFVDHAQMEGQERYLKQSIASQRISASGANAPETELSSLLNTIRSMAFEARGITVSVLQRVSPQLPDEGCEAQCFSSGYIGTAEEIRSTLAETIRLLGALSKLA